MRNLLLILVLAIVPALGCSMFKGEVATDPQYVPPGVAYTDTGVPISGGVGNYVFVDDDVPLPPEAPKLSADQLGLSPRAGSTELWKAVEPYIPWKALGPVALYFAAKLGGKRYRQNVGSSLSSLAKLDVKNAIRMAAAAEGIVHTTEDPAKLMAVAQRKAAVAAVVNVTEA